MDFDEDYLDEKGGEEGAYVFDDDAPLSDPGAVDDDADGREDDGSDSEDDDGSDHSDVDEDDAEAIDMEAADESETPSRAGGSNSKTLDEQRNGKALADHRIPSPSDSATRAPSLPPSLKRRHHLYPSPPIYVNPPSALLIQPLVSTPILSPVFSLVATPCLSWVLTGSEDGFIRAWDTYASANAGLKPTIKIEDILREGPRIGGISRGWWGNDAGPERRKEAVHSLAIQREALWGLSGTETGSINLFTIRHAMGSIKHTLTGGHTSVVSSLALTDSEDVLFSGGRDGGIIEWDLNTGQQLRSFPRHAAHITSLSLQPTVSTSSGRTKGTNFDEVSPIPQKLSTPRAAPGSLPSANGEAKIPLEDMDASPTKRTLSDLDAEGEEDSVDADGESDLFGDFSNAPSPSAAPPAPSPATAEAVPGKKLPTFPAMTPESYATYSSDVLLSSAIDGSVTLWDRRVSPSESGGMRGVGRLQSREKTPKWCMSACFSATGNHVYAGRRDGTVDIWDIRRAPSSTTTPNLLHSIRNPSNSGPVSSVVAFPDGTHLACASKDNIRLWSTSSLLEEISADPTPTKRPRTPAFKIIPGHQSGVISSMIVDPSSNFLITASGDRGWPGLGEATGVVLFHHVESVYGSTSKVR